MNHVVISQFPNSRFDPFLVTSPKTPTYNCIAWAFNDPSKWYWPDPKNIYFWPEKVPREITLDSFKSLFKSIGYTSCDNGNFEIDFEKVAIFIDNYEVPTHAARQLSNGLWTSKLGQHIDVQHSIKSMEEGEYGMVGAYMKRKIYS